MDTGEKREEGEDGNMKGWVDKGREGWRMVG